MPGANTKLMMSVTSLVILGINSAKQREGVLNKDFMIVCLWALLVSLTTLFAVFYNNTRDYTYVTYIISMLVWTGGAYTLMSIIKMIHGKVQVPLVVNYLITACVMQCILAVVIDRSSVVESFCASFCAGLSELKGLLKSERRLYGVGCSFDPAGLRFAAVLVMMGYFFPLIVDKNKKRLACIYTLAFIIISIVGNMIARSTTVGMIIALVYILYSLKLHTLKMDTQTRRLWRWCLALFLFFVMLVLPLYHLDSSFRGSFRFGFEGFFSLIERGKWEVHSNEVLVTMYRFPDTLKTWIIGDGYFFNTNLDPYYVGKEYKEYYMATDVGYLRFIYYSGLIGLIAFVLFMCKAAFICMQKHEKYRMLFFSVLILQILIWLKVASDIYCVLALFLMINKNDKTDTVIEANG